MYAALQAVLDSGAALIAALDSGAALIDALGFGAALKAALDFGAALIAVPDLTVAFVIAALGSDTSLTAAVDSAVVKVVLDFDTFLTNVGGYCIDVYDLFVYVE